ncbi:hypothetical protein [Paenibacillus agilis]|uniref:Uncharacterized protein n=1 Tax=Paenibacillus agilis TaxID=3020863 RepID=A0A559IX79_9BACL|nr:hypothetical protein [Paenibacillus agilis]TVX92232.1 hypothetical protein FPZ44_03655 [Paenibacillus agilis]
MLTPAGHNKMKAWLQSFIKEGRYFVGNTAYTTPIFKVEQVGDLVTFYLYLTATGTGTGAQAITRFQLIDQDGDVFDDQPDSIEKPEVNGLLVVFKYTLRKV